MPKKTNLTLPPLKIKAKGTVLPTEKELADFFDEAVAVLKQKDRRKAIEDEIDKIELFTPKTPRESLDKGKSLKALQQQLRNLTEPKRLNQIHRLKVREAAKQLWCKHPEWTIQKMCGNDELKNITDRKAYAIRTLRSWINDLAPNRRPGRRKIPC
jgi:RecG-like helicase